MSKVDFASNIQELMGKVLHHLKVTGDRKAAVEYSKDLSDTITEAVEVLGYQTAKPLITDACNRAEEATQ